MVIPQWLSAYLQAEDLPQLEAAIHQAERITSAEIRPIVVKSSSSYSQVPTTLRLMGLILFILAWHIQGWDLYWDSFESSLLHVGIGLFLALIVLPLLARYGCVQRWMTHAREEEEQVWKRAQIEFYLNHMDKTQTGHGVLIFISLLEHRVVVLADRPVAEKLPAKVWSEVVQSVTMGLRQKNLRKALEAGVQQCATVLAEHFPIQQNDSNELPNTLIIKE